MSRNKTTPGQRQLRVGEELRHALAYIFERGELRDPVLTEVTLTVTEVRISPDLRQATVFVMPLGGGREDAVVAALGRAKSFLRRQLAASVQLKFVPDLHFRSDRTFEEADRIARALRLPQVAGDLSHGEDDEQADVETPGSESPRG